MSSKLFVWNKKAKNTSSKPGVYGLYNEDYHLIYVGHSKNLQETFTGYLKTNFYNDICKQDTKYYNRQFYANPLERKKTILEEFKKKYGTYPKCNIVKENLNMLTEKKDLSETRFHFYEDIGKPIGKTALNLKDFTSKLREIPLNCIEFHHKRGDFAKWIQNSLQDKTLAAAIRKIEAFGEELRTQLIEIITQQENTKNCPKCKASLLPKKTWSMTGKIVGDGIRPKLTLGYYKCPNCGKGFRKVLAKELIKVN